MNIVFPEDNYDTGPDSTTLWGRHFPSLTYLWKVVNIVLHDGNLAKAGKYGGKEWAEGSLNTLRALESCGVKFHVDGMNHIDAADGPCVFIANHMSTLETFILPIFIQPRRPVTFVVKQSLLDYPWFGPVLASRDPIVVGRDNPRKDLTTVLEEGTKRLSAGTSLIVFPQSTRSDALDLSLFNSIGIKVAKRAGVPVIPVALRTDAWGVGRIVKDFGPIRPDIPVHFSFGEPFNVEGNGKAEHARVVSYIREHAQMWGVPVINEDRV